MQHSHIDHTHLLTGHLHAFFFLNHTSSSSSHHHHITSLNWVHFDVIYFDPQHLYTISQTCFRMSIQEQSDALWGGEKFILGPMVRANSAALRWGCLHFGADVVYSEELLARRASQCKRSENSVLETVDFVRGGLKKEGNVASSPDVVSQLTCSAPVHLDALSLWFLMRTFGNVCLCMTYIRYFEPMHALRKPLGGAYYSLAPLMLSLLSALLGYLRKMWPLLISTWGVPNIMPRQQAWAHS